MSMAKRCLDVVIAASLLVLLCPLMLGIWALVRLRLGKPAFFSQWRPACMAVPIAWSSSERSRSAGMSTEARCPMSSA